MKTAENETTTEMIGEMTIQGRIVHTEWDKRGNVTGIGIKSNGEEYVVFLNRMGEKLFRHLNRKVEATGTVKKMFEELILTIGEYRLLKEDEEDA
jgi:hypothetical protein